MSQYLETNPHFRPDQAQTWDNAPNPRYSDEPRAAPPHRINPKTRNQWGRPRSPPPQRPLTPPDHHQPDPDSFLSVLPTAQQNQPQSQPPPRPQHGPGSSSSSRPQHGPGPSSSSRPQPPAHSRTKPIFNHQSRPQHSQYPPPSPHRDNLMYPTLNKTKPLTWFGAVFCCILWLVIILGGLLVLIIYLIYRPRTPHFEISNASLNAAYLDMGTLLNADLTVLANFSNPNKKVNVDFSYVTLRLSFANHPIAIQYIEPFSAVNTEKKLHFVELVSSQVRLPAEATKLMAIQMQKNRVVFEVEGTFHTRSNFGSLLRYSYWLYGHCTIVMTAPPTGVMIQRSCRTKD